MADFVQSNLFEGMVPGAVLTCDSGSAKLGRSTDTSRRSVLDFSYNGSAVRVVMRGAEPWFVGKDVCAVLGYTNASKALMDHVDDEDKLNNKSLSSLGQRGGWLINESGVYSLILRSNLPDARRFKRWVTHEVLPSIRKTGGYIAAKPEDPPEVIMARALLVADATIKQYQSKIDVMCHELAEQAEAIEVMTPKAALADAFIVSKGDILVRDFAKHIKQALCLRSWGEAKMFAWLKSSGYMNLNRYPSQYSIQLGILSVREGTHQEGDQLVRHHVTRITPKGQAYFYQKLKEAWEAGVIEA